MALESTILQVLRQAGEPISLNEIAAAASVDTHDTAEVSTLRSMLGSLVHRRQLTRRGNLDGIVRYALTGAPIQACTQATDTDVMVMRKPSAVGTTECPGAIPVHPDSMPSALPVDSSGAPWAPPMDISLALKGLGKKSILVYQAMRSDEWVDRGTLDFRTKLSTTEVLTGLAALRRRGLVAAQGTTSNTLWRRLGDGAPADAAHAEEEDAAALVASTVPPPAKLADVVPNLAMDDAGDAKRYRWLILNAAISIDFGCLSLKTEYPAELLGAKALWDGAIDTMLTLQLSRTEFAHG